MVMITDGTGKGFSAKVDSENRQHARSFGITDLEHAAEEGLAFFVVSTFSAADGDEVISIRNTNSDRNLVINRIKCAAVDGGTVATVWTLFEVTSGTAAGTTVTAQNSNLNSGIVAQATIFGDNSVTGSLAGNTLGFAVSNHDIDAELIVEGALVLAEGDEIAVTVTDADAPAAVYISVLMHFEEAGE